MLARRGFLTGVFSAMAAPAIVRAASLMPVKALPPEVYTLPPEIFMQNICTAAIDPAMVTMDFSTIGQLELVWRQRLADLYA